VVSFTPRTLYPQGKGRYPTNSRLVGPQSRSGRGGEEKKSLPCLCRGSNPDRPSHRLVAILTDLPQLHLPMRIWKDNINMDPKEIRYEGMDWIHVAQNRDQWRALVNTVINVRLSYKATS